MRGVLLALAASAAAQAHRDTPVTKVVALLQELQAKVVIEGKSEAATYEKFACFCKDMTDEKSGAIDEGSGSVAALDGDLAARLSDRDTADGDIAAFVVEISRLSGELKDEKTRRKSEFSLYQRNALDLSRALQALHSAVKVIKAKGHLSLLSAQTVRKAVSMAELMGLSGAGRAAQAALAQIANGDIPLDVPIAVYDSQSTPVLEALESLQKDFRSRQTTVDAEETANSGSHNTLVQTLSDNRETAEKNLASRRKDRNGVVEDIGLLQADLTVTSAKLREDQKYLQKTTAHCEAKSGQWDERTQMRSDELAALSQALQLLQGEVSASTTEQTVRFGAAVAPLATSFVQRRLSLGRVRSHGASSSKAEGAADFEKREQVAQLLTAAEARIGKGAALVATVLARVEGGDPFAKVKVMIQELVERLQQQLLDEESHHGWCTEQTTLAKQERDLQAALIQQLNTALGKEEASRDQLAADLEALVAEHSALTNALSDASIQRGEEAGEAATAIFDAEAGGEAVAGAIQILDRFYKSAKNSTSSSFVQISASDSGFHVLKHQHGSARRTAQAPPAAGFDDAPYAGSQGDSTGVIGMLRVIEGDFARTVSATNSSEKEAIAAFTEFDRDTRGAIAANEATHHSKNEEHINVLASIAANGTALDDSIARLGNSLNELGQLWEACEKQESFEDRSAKRDEEVAALKEALCILDSEGPVSTEDCIGSAAIP